MQRLGKDGRLLSADVRSNVRLKGHPQGECQEEESTAPGTKKGAMEYPYGWMPDPAWEGWDEERLLIESELEMQIWR